MNHTTADRTTTQLRTELLWVALLGITLLVRIREGGALTCAPLSPMSLPSRSSRRTLRQAGRMPGGADMSDVACKVHAHA